jgi:hypothetical protein
MVAIAARWAADNFFLSSFFVAERPAERSVSVAQPRPRSAVSAAEISADWPLAAGGVLRGVRGRSAVLPPLRGLAERRKWRRNGGGSRRNVDFIAVACMAEFGGMPRRNGGGRAHVPPQKR